MGEQFVRPFEPAISGRSRARAGELRSRSDAGHEPGRDHLDDRSDGDRPRRHPRRGRGRSDRRPMHAAGRRADRPSRVPPARSRSPARRGGPGARRAGGPARAVAVGRPVARGGRGGFIDALGATYRSSLWLFVLPADRAVPPPVFPADVVVRPIRPELDDAPLCRPGQPGLRGPPVAAVLVRRRTSASSTAGRTSTRPSVLVDDPERRAGPARRAVPDARAAGRRRHGVARSGSSGCCPTGAAGAWAGSSCAGASPISGRSGFGEIELSVEARNVPALELYDSEGFRASVEWPHWVVPAI